MRPVADKFINNQVAVKAALFCTAALLWVMPAQVWANSPEYLWLSIAPSITAGPDCELHEAPPPAKSRGRGQQGGRPQKPQRFESEHRPVPVRTYYLKGPALSPQAEAYVLHPDGSSQQLKINYGAQPSVTVKTPMADDRLHGANNVYVIDKQVNDGVLTVQSAKWLAIHHSCGWGHDYRNDEPRKTAHSLAQVPLEIVINGLWDGNFHAGVRSGEDLAMVVNREGVPLQGALVTITTEKQWSHSSISDSNGTANIQLIRDYYPTGWAKFKRDQQGLFTVTAQYSKEEEGQYNGQPYERIQYIATFPWKYSPAKADYTSYAFGLGLGSFALLFSGIGIYSFRERRKKPYKGINLD